ncbi:MAG: indole-3-glycerol phosphate synthase TrpC [Anaerolineae bacterium]|nr:indole-3-glycerol phosphate synthase TrpC [Anaerolineae bacterium]
MSVTNLAKQRGTILDEIMRHHREQLPKIMREIPLADLRAHALFAPPPVDFAAALRLPGLSLIAECKKASPSKGLLAPEYDPVHLATTYVRAGARAISVLTDGRHFQGSLEHLRDVKEALSDLDKLVIGKSDPRLKIGLPVLRKDFIFHPYQVYEARVAGADAVLLIAAVLGPNDMKELLALTHQLGMNALIEVHTAAEVERILPLNPRIIGINNRNLQTFAVDFDNTARLRQLIPTDVLVVGESGIQTTDDVRQMKNSGANAILVGETFVKSKDLFKTVQSFVKAGH